MKCLHYFTFVLVLVAIATEGKRFCDRKCFFGMKCWPSVPAITDFALSLEGDFYHPGEPAYHQVNIMKNDRVKSWPVMIVFVKSVDDVKKCIHFANKYNIRVSIMSSGHSFTGRSAHDGSLLINMSNMTEIAVRTDLTNRSPGGEVTVQSGNSWARVYQEVDKYSRTVVGGSAHTVAMGGYTQGGGHSPLSRSLGLAVDNLLEVELVTAQGHHIRTSEKGIYNEDTKQTSSDTDLFWALRGGGGGTWGVVISFTFKIHIPPPQLVHFSSFYPMVVNDTVPGIAALRSVIDKIKQLPKEWGGYIITSTAEQPGPPSGVYGVLTLSLLHYGAWNSPSMQAIEPLMTDPLSVYKGLTNKTSFWDYEKDVNDEGFGKARGYVVNSLLPSNVDSAKISNVVVEEMFAGLTETSGTGCTFTLLGGKMTEAKKKSTPINPGFRSALFSLSCGRVWFSALNDESHLKHSDRFNSRIVPMGKGVYFNEPAENLTTWKTDFWGKGGNYERLLEIKRKYDYNNFFCCHNCVGYDLDDGDDKWRPNSGAKNDISIVLLTMVILSFLSS